MNPAREIPGTPIIKLGPSFHSVDSFLERCGETEYHNRDEFVSDAHEEGAVSPCMPDIVGLEHLTLQGNIHFGKGIVFRGTVIIVADEGARIDIPNGTVLEDAVVMVPSASCLIDHTPPPPPFFLSTGRLTNMCVFSQTHICIWLYAMIYNDDVTHPKRSLLPPIGIQTCT